MVNTCRSNVLHCSNCSDELYLPPMRKIDSLLSEQKKRLLRRVTMSAQHQVNPSNLSSTDQLTTPELSLLSYRLLSSVSRRLYTYSPR